MTTIRADIAAVLDGTTADISALLAVLARIAVHYDTPADVEAASIPASVKRVFVTGYAASGDGGAFSLTAQAAAGEPGHPAGKYQSDDGRWWVLDDHHPNPMQFGAKWDWGGDKTNDTPAINTWAAFLRYTRRVGEMPGGAAYAADTCYLGGARYWGAGGINNGTAASISGTTIFSDGNPALAGTATAATTGTFHADSSGQVCWKAAGGTVATINLPDHANYPYQIGMWMGYSHNHLADEDFIGTATGGGHPLHAVTFDGFSGHGAVFVGCWGRNLFSEVFVRNCGEVAAEALGNHMGCGVYVGPGCVDFDVDGIHCYGHAEDEYGTGIRIGDLKSATDARGISWAPPANVRIGNVYCEGYPVPLDVRASKHLKIEWPTLAGTAAFPGVIKLGHPQNPRNDQAIQIIGLKTFNMDGIDIWSGQVTLEMYRQQQSGSDVEWRYRAPVRLIRSEPASWINPAGYRNPLLMTPVGDIAGETGSVPAWSFVPWLDGGNEPGSPLANLLPPFATTASDAAPSNGWTRDSAGTFGIPTPSRVNLRAGEQIYYDVTGLTAGELMTAILWLDVGAGNLNEVTYGVTNGSSITVISRTVGLGTTDRVKVRRMFNFLAPANGVARLFVTGNSATNDVRVDHPIVCRGAVGDPGPALTVWPTTQGAVPVGAHRWPHILTGVDTPQGAVIAPIGTLFQRTNGGTNTALYVKETGTGNTGWVAK
jgi:hypothetical protein